MGHLSLRSIGNKDDVSPAALYRGRGDRYAQGSFAHLAESVGNNNVLISGSGGEEVSFGIFHTGSIGFFRHAGVNRHRLTPLVKQGLNFDVQTGE
ncbi:hypothetical protein ES703_116395 [subsurface metagenome]